MSVLQRVDCTPSSVQTLIDFTRSLLTFKFVIASMRSMVFKCLDYFLCFSLGSRTSHHENTQCYFSVGLQRTVCAFISLTLDNILQQYVPLNNVAKFYPNCFLLLLWKISDQMMSLDYYEARRIPRAVLHFYEGLSWVLSMIKFNKLIVKRVKSNLKCTESKLVKKDNGKWKKY